MWNTVGVNSPAILYMLGIINNRPCDAVNVVHNEPGLQRAVHGARRAAFTLHLLDQWNGAPDVLLALGHPLIRPFAHGGRRGDRVNGDHLAGAEGNVGRSLVAV